VYEAFAAAGIVGGPVVRGVRHPRCSPLKRGWSTRFLAGFASDLVEPSTAPKTGCTN
jgi:hypothetical protein